MKPTIEQLEAAFNALIAYENIQNYDLCEQQATDFMREHTDTVWAALQQSLAIAKGDMVVVPREASASKCNLCHKDTVKLLEAHDIVKLLLPLAKGYVHANSGIRSTETIIKDAEAMINAAQEGK